MFDENEKAQIAICQHYVTHYGHVPFPNNNLMRLISKLATENAQLLKENIQLRGVLTAKVPVNESKRIFAKIDNTEEISAIYGEPVEAPEEYTEFQRKIKDRYGRK